LIAAIEIMVDAMGMGHGSGHGVKGGSRRTPQQ
jgi:hypothetical protein